MSHPALSALARPVAEKLLPRAWLDGWYRRRFFASRGWANRHYGVFPSFAAARECVRRHGGGEARFTLDHATWLRERLQPLPHDYPMLFWLGRALAEGGESRRAGAGPDRLGGPRIVDLGGSVGVSYLMARRLLPMPAGLRWQVVELPEVLEAGRRVALEHEAPALSFESDPGLLDGADLLWAAGAVQYIEEPLQALLSRLAAPPRWLLVNRLPLIARRAGYVTLQHSGTAASPYRVENEEAFGAALAALGYEPLDRWKCLENSLAVPLAPALGLRHFIGGCWRRREA